MPFRADDITTSEHSSLVTEIGDVEEYSTTDATQYTLVASSIAVNSLVMLKAEVSARANDNSCFAGFIKTVMAYNTGAGAILGTIQDDYTYRTNTNLNCTFTTNNNDVRVSVTGLAGTTINWDGILRTTRLS